MGKKSKKEFKEEANILQYSVWALEGEIENLRWIIEEYKGRVWDLIQENDRLTLRYEPWRPEGGEDEGLDFYGLVEENAELRKQVSRLVNTINDLDWEISRSKNAAREREVDQIRNGTRPPAKGGSFLERWFGNGRD